ncbi:MAG: FAD:protein FMN transferase [Deltaproteobacteria bacterium]|nr:FAD:protein FMN transferase [Deltaproteobacteria bacterium]
MDVKVSRIAAYLAVILTVLIIVAIPFYLKKNKESVTYSKALMGTVVQITLMEGDKGSFDTAAKAAFDEIKRLEEVFSSYKPDSDVSRINRNAGSLVEVSPELITVLKAALQAAELSDGAFDPTVGILGKVWGYSGEKGHVPSKKELAPYLLLVDYREIAVDGASSKAGLKKKGMALNLGGVAKGYIVKRAVEVLKKNGVERGLIHAGGDIVVFQKNEKMPFTIGIQHPREKRLLGEALVYNGAIATSGDYERFFEKDGKRYHHILDPKIGFPAMRSRSATVIAGDATIADALSTAVFVMGSETGMALIERLPDVEGVIVDSEGKVYKSSGFKGKIFN